MQVHCDCRGDSTHPRCRRPRPRRHAWRFITAVALIAVAAVLGAMPRRMDGQVPISIIPRLYELRSWRSELEELHGLALLQVPPASLSHGTQLAKRLVDLVGSALAFLLIFPVGLALAVAIRLDSAGPAFFRQQTAAAGRSGCSSSGPWHCPVAITAHGQLRGAYLSAGTRFRGRSRRLPRYPDGTHAAGRARCAR